MKSEIKYTTAGGGTVVWKEGRGWNCRACGDEGAGKWGTARDANEHARGCQAQD